MHAITVESWGSPPAFGTVETPTAPPPDSSLVQVKVLAAGLHSLVRAQASGAHYSVKNARLPYIPGSDGVGTLADGTVVYFSSMLLGGAFAEYVNVPKADVKALPAGADPVQVAGLVNPGMSSWMAFKARVDNLPKAFSVVILGVTAISGKVAVNFSRLLGAGKVIGVARNVKEMEQLALDQSIVLKDPVEDTDYSALGDVDLILDYLYGPPALRLLNSLNSSRPTQYVQIGSVAGQEVSLSAGLLRSKDLTLRGTGPGSWTMEQFDKVLAGLLTAVSQLPKFDIKARKLEQAEEAWQDKRGRTVFVP